jgi:hypothetical protein
MTEVSIPHGRIGISYPCRLRIRLRGSRVPHLRKVGNSESAGIGVWQRFATNLATSSQLFEPEEIVDLILLEVAAINKNRNR